MYFLESLSERRALLVSSAFFIFLIGAVLAPFIFGGRIFIDGDAILYYYPAFDFYADALKSGESFLWNPYIFSGFPTYLSQSAGFFDPLNIVLFRLFDSFTGYHLRIFTDLFLVMFFSYVASRTLGLSRTASALVGPGFLLAFNWGYLSNPVIVNSLFLVPFIVWTGLNINGSRGLWWGLAAGAGIGWSLLSGYAQITVYATFLLGVIVVGDFIVRGHHRVLGFVRMIAILSSAVVVGVIVALPQLLAAFDFIPLTLRSGGLSYELATGKVIRLGDLLLLLFPDNLYFPYVSAGRRPLYVGAFLFISAVIGIGALIRSIRSRMGGERERRMLLIGGIALFCFVAALQYSPLYYTLQQLPVFSYFRFPYRWMYLGAWFLACLGAYGFDRMRSSSPEPWQKKIATVFIAGTVAGTAVVFALNFFGSLFWKSAADLLHTALGTLIYGHFGFTKDHEHYRDALGRGIDAWREAVSLMEPAFILPFAALLAAVILLFLYARGRLLGPWFSVAGFTVSVLTFIGVFTAQWPVTLEVPIVSIYEHALAVAPELRDTEYRTFPFMLGEGLSAYVPPQYVLSTEERLAASTYQLATGWPNVHQYASMRSVDGYDPFVPAAMLHVLEKLGSTHGGEEATKKLSPEQKKERLLTNLDLLGALSGKYVLSGVPLAHRDLRLLREIPVPPYGIPLYVYENRQALSRIYLASRIENNAKSIADMSPEVRDFETTYLTCGTCRNHPVRQRDRLAVEVEKNGYIVVRTTTEGSRWLVVHESNVPGWRVTIDGIAATIECANGLYLAVEVPAGEHAVVLEYRGIRGERGWLNFFGL